MEILSLEAVGKRFGSRWAVRYITLDLQAGDWLGLWGPSGAGKSVLLKLVGGLLSPSEGRLTLQKRTDLGWFRKQTAYLPQHSFADPALTVYQWLEWSAKVYGLSPKVRASLLYEVLERFQLHSLRDQPIGLLAPGTRRRVEVATLFLRRPSLLLLDCPEEAMDASGRETFHRYLRDLLQEGMTLITASSHPEYLERCTRLAVLVEGRLIAFDRLETLRASLGPEEIRVQPRDTGLTSLHLKERLRLEVEVTPEGFCIRVPQAEPLVGEILRDFGPQISAVLVRRPSLTEVLTALEERGYRV